MLPGEQQEIQKIAAQAIVALEHDAPATLRVGRAVFALRRLLPPSGTPEYRAALAAAHALDHPADVGRDAENLEDFS